MDVGITGEYELWKLLDSRLIITDDHLHSDTDKLPHRRLLDAYNSD